MKKFVFTLALIATLSLGIACSSNKNKETSTTENTASGANSQNGMANSDVAKVSDENMRKELDQNNLGAVKVNIDNDKKIVNLSGEVASDQQKSQAEQIAKEHASGYVVSNEVAVRPENNNHDAGKVASNLDDSIKSQWKALAAQNNWDDQHIRSSVKNGVLTLKGDVDTQTQRTQIEKAAAQMPHVRQVVNELAVKNASQ